MDITKHGYYDLLYCYHTTRGNIRKCEGGRGRGEGRRVGKGKKGVKDCGHGGKIGEGEK